VTVQQQTLDGSSEFDLATAVTPMDVPGRYAVTVDPEWSINGYPNGGYVLALATRAALTELGRISADDGRPQPDVGRAHEQAVAVTGAFTAPAPFGPATVDVELLRRGRGTSVARSRVTSEGEVRLEVLVTAGRLGAPVLHPGPVCPPMPPEDECPRAPVDAGPLHVPLLGRLSERFDLATVGFALGRPSGQGELRAWVRFDDGRDPDPLALVLIGDCLPPPTFDLPQVAFGWVPTLQLSTFVRAVPAPGPLVVRSVARSVGSGAVDETCDVWDSEGRHVAVAHQLAAVRPA
jgi:hypothetical protein